MLDYTLRYVFVPQNGNPAHEKNWDFKADDDDHAMRKATEEKKRIGDHGSSFQVLRLLGVVE